MTEVVGDITTPAGREDVLKASPSPVKPDAVFPNNWVTFHQEGFIVTYPMFAPTRRRERRRSVIDEVPSA